MDDPSQNLPSCPLCDEDHQRGSSDCPARRIDTTIAGHYRIERLLGVGGMGVVYEAVDERDERRVALKMLLPKHRNNPEVIIRFQREAERAMSLDHPGIVRVVRLGLHDERDPYFEMELLRGRALRALDDGEPFEPLRAARLFVQVLDALASAHAHGLVHRDLKPENIFLLDGTGTAGEHERVKILDFGIAKTAALSMQLTVSGKVLGTPYYMSPEQATGSRTLDARSDVYSAGASLYQILTAQYPVEGESFPEILARLAQGRTRRHPREVNPRVPLWLDAVVARAMATMPIDRYATALDMKRALEHGLSRGDTPRRWPAPAAALVAALLMLASIAVAAHLHRGHAPACGRLPHATVRADGGRCIVGVCQAGFGDCDGDARNGCEVDFRTSDVHCGRCETVCALGHAASQCMSGSCQLQGCAAGFGDCNATAADGCEADLSGDVQHCGACDTVCPTGAHATPACLGGRCDARCETGRGDCNADAVDGCETDLSSDGANCGTCGHACTSDQSCRNGLCTESRCPTGRGDCDGAGTCDDDLTHSIAHCGQCGHVCHAPHANDACSHGRCEIAHCAAGYADCDGHPGNGCEVATAADALHCGGCNAVCAPANATGACVAGTCTVSACAAGYADCDHAGSNGCEASPASDPRNCGACGHACGATQVCASGACVCAPGTRDCGAGRCAECCSDDDCPSHRACNASGHCGGCAGGYADCDRDSSNGCETDTTGSERDCGGCGLVCAPAHGEGACVRGLCRVTSCTQGRADCDHDARNGCEIELATDVRGCGACGHPCTSGQQCVAGSCACAAGTRDCGNGRCAECCAASDCGANRVCRTDGRCGACTEGFTDCDHDPLDGCETATATDVRNCGGCGTACSAGQSCVAGHCTGA